MIYYAYMNIKLNFLIVFIFFTQTIYSEKNFTFSAWNKPDIEVFYYLPEEVNQDTKVLFVIHGASRTAERYLNHWKSLTFDKNIIVIAPKFSEDSFPSFNTLVIDSKTEGYLLNPDNYIGDSISIIFNFFKSKFDLNDNTYRMYGHSGGSQFVHRYLLFGVDARAEKVVMANAGWYTFLNDVNYPYGIKDVPVTQERLEWFLSLRAAVLLGDKDVNPNADNLRNNSKAKIQGRHRYERGLAYFRDNIAVAEKLEVPFRWKLEVVEGVGHQNSLMTTHAANFLLSDL